MRWLSAVPQALQVKWGSESSQPSLSSSGIFRKFLFPCHIGSEWWLLGTRRGSERRKWPFWSHIEEEMWQMWQKMSRVYESNEIICILHMECSLLLHVPHIIFLLIITEWSGIAHVFIDIKSQNAVLDILEWTLGRKKEKKTISWFPVIMGWRT